MDAGEIGPRWNPGHGHADFLAVEVDVDGHRFIVDPGTSQYSTGPQRMYERSAAGHNGPRYLDVEPVEYSGCFKVGKLASAAPIAATVLEDLPTESIGGTITTPAGLCIRVICALNGGLLIVDRWNSSDTPGATTLLIPNDWRLDTDRRRTVRAAQEGAQTAITVYEGAIDGIEERTWSRRYLQPEQATAVTLAPTRVPSGARCWCSVSASASSMTCLRSAHAWKHFSVHTGPRSLREGGSTMLKNQKDASIETLRGLACILLVAFHVIGENRHGGLHVPDDSTFRWYADSFAYLRMPCSPSYPVTSTPYVR